eukprot:TRINITY_DN1715_c0_g2_i7.p1 TRINITY_DN1715_c0_g2~~TRINITY_DN1715_c0_g2_i7.p1  ORF type:complete len:222 (+),score=-25.44 TRINITY_DN1715_c0_g2_i7:128-793(+)
MHTPGFLKILYYPETTHIDTATNPNSSNAIIGACPPDTCLLFNFITHFFYKYLICFCEQISSSLVFSISVWTSQLFQLADLPFLIHTQLITRGQYYQKNKVYIPLYDLQIFIPFLHFRQQFYILKYKKYTQYSKILQITIYVLRFTYLLIGRCVIHIHMTCFTTPNFLQSAKSLQHNRNQLFKKRQKTIEIRSKNKHHLKSCCYGQTVIIIQRNLQKCNQK